MSHSFYFLVFLVILAWGRHQQWQTVDHRALQYIFGNETDLDPEDFSNATNYNEVQAVCQRYAEKYKNIDPSIDGGFWIPGNMDSMEQKIDTTSAACRDFFQHRIWVQKWANFLFKEITKDYGNSSTLGRMVLKPWTSAEQDDPADGISFMQTVKAIQDQFCTGLQENDPRDRLLFKLDEGQLRGDTGYLWHFASQKFVENCAYSSDNLTVAYDFSPNSWQHALVELGLMQDF